MIINIIIAFFSLFVNSKQKIGDISHKFATIIQQKNIKYAIDINPLLWYNYKDKNVAEGGNRL